MSVVREADALPELPEVAVSETTICTLPIGTPTASAAICAITVCAPCPQSAPPAEVGGGRLEIGRPLPRAVVFRPTCFLSALLDDLANGHAFGAFGADRPDGVVGQYVLQPDFNR